MKAAENPWDVVVLGAGAAGLAAAERLSRAGLTVLLLEARERVGGRIWTYTDPHVPVPIELGAEFIHGPSAATFDLLNKAGTPAIDAPGVHWALSNGRLEPSDGLFDDIQALLKRVDSFPEQDVSIETLLDRTKSERSLERARVFLRRMVEGFDAADPARASARAIAEEWEEGGVGNSPQFRPSAGYGALTKWLVDSLDRDRVKLRLQAVVQSVQWREGTVEVHGRSLQGPFSIRARRGVITFPLSILKAAPDAANAVRFEPALDAKQRALAGIELGPVLKVVLHFRRAFWESFDDGRYREVTFFHAPDAVFPTFWTAVPVRVPVMTAWVGGPTAQELLSSDDRSTIIGNVTASLRKLFGSRFDQHAELEGAYYHNWQHDPFIRGAYSYVATGGSKAREQLAEPLDDTLFFAGEAADTQGEAGTVGGALQSGVRAAQQILVSAGSPRLTETDKSGQRA